MGWQDAPIVDGKWQDAPATAPKAPIGDASQGGKFSGAAMGFTDLPIAVGQVLQNIPGVDKGLNLLRSGIRGGLGAVGATDAAELFGPVSGAEFNQLVQSREQQYEADRAAAGREGFDASRLAGNLANPMGLIGGGALKGAPTVLNLAKMGAKAGAVSAAMQPVTNGGGDFWQDKAGQTAAGAAAGAVLTPVVSKAANALASGVSKVGQAVRSRMPADPGKIDIQVNNVFRSQGIAPADIPDTMRESVRRQVNEAMDVGGRIDPAAMMRKAEFEAVGLTGDAAPTMGQATRDPMQFASEKNLSGVRIKTPQGEGNPLADRFNLQQQRLGDIFDQSGATGAVDRGTAGQTLINALRESDAPVKQGVDQAYQAARAMTGGRVADLERGAFTQAANDALDQGMWGRFVPDNIRGLLNDITAGKTPFNVDAAVQIDGILSAAQRRAGSGSPEASAIGVIRDALQNTPMARPASAVPVGAADDIAAQAARTVDEGVTDVAARMAPELPAPPSSALAPDFEIPLPRQTTAVGPAVTPPIDEGAAAREAFDQARRAARARFSTIEDTPALKAALDNAAPDDFVRDFVLNADARDVRAMREVLKNSPEALDQARAQVADHLKRAAFGENPSGDKAFTADRYLKTLRAIGRDKLEAFFSPAEIMRLNLAGKVASDINSIPAGAKYGTNTSGTGAAVMNLLSGLTESPLMRQIPGARMLANQIGEIKTERAINNALRPPIEKPAVQPSPETLRALQFLFAPAGVAGGALAGGAVNQ